HGTFLPTHAKGGFILSETGGDNALTAKIIRLSTAHAPIGEYRRDFHPNEPSACPTCATLETREHILFMCPRFNRSRCFNEGDFAKSTQQLSWITKFLEKNPTAFAFDSVPYQPP
ncbi:hypothetical protein BD779DRAFT_1571137, partial [Infundibulicybe gibba]